MLTTGTRVQVRWSGKTGTVLPRDASVRGRMHSELVRLDPVPAPWADAATLAMEVIYRRRDLQILTDQTPPATEDPHSERRTAHCAG